MAVRTAADMGATVINVSTVACLPAPRGSTTGALGAALAYAVDVKNVVVVAAAGNVGGPGPVPRTESAAPTRPAPVNRIGTACNVVASPAWYDDYVLTVGSVDVDGRRRRSASRGRGWMSRRRAKASCRWIPTGRA